MHLLEQDLILTEPHDKTATVIPYKGVPVFKYRFKRISTGSSV